MPEFKKPGNLYEHLQLIRPRVGMYVGGTKSLFDLANYIRGYNAAEWVNGIKPELSNFLTFHEFVRKEYKLPSSSEGGPSMILKRNKNDEDKALDDFYRLLDLFVKAKGQI